MLIFATLETFLHSSTTTRYLRQQTGFLKTSWDRRSRTLTQLAHAGALLRFVDMRIRERGITKAQIIKLGWITLECQDVQL